MAKVAFSPDRTKVNNKELYETPSTMVLEVRQEGVICGSLTDPDDYNNGGDPFAF